jgi:ubiquinone/menaquinone biosynthesis C-methylase UbiE
MSDNKYSDSGEDTRDAVREAYGKIATTKTSCCSSSSSVCCPLEPDKLAEIIGYKKSDLDLLPEGANLGLSCGNPSAIAELKEGERVLDLGSGAGFDAFIVANKVGNTGCVIGVDMTPSMISKARRNAFKFAEKSGLSNIEFRLGEIEHLPVEDESIDVIISNCVINLSPDKPQTWRDAYRVLKPGGRVAVSDLALKQSLPEKLRQSLDAYVGCMAGASLIPDIERMLKDAGFTGLELTEQDAYTKTEIDWSDPLYRKIIELLPEGSHISDYVVSLNIKAVKPVCSC